jgi:DNA-binding transcriptional ArsR family regulator
MTAPMRVVRPPATNVLQRSPESAGTGQAMLFGRGGPSMPVQAISEDDLSRQLGALANPVRLRLVRRLQKPAFISEIAHEFALTRQALLRHLGELQRAGIVSSRRRRRRAVLAVEYSTDPAGFFTLREQVADLGVLTGAMGGEGPTRHLAEAHAPRPAGAGLLMVHGDARGRWYPLVGRSSWTIGRDPHAEIPLPYDQYASLRHARMERKGGAWRLEDLGSTNGTSVNFIRLPPRAAAAVGLGDVVGIGRTLLVLRG